MIRSVSRALLVWPFSWALLLMAPSLLGQSRACGTEPMPVRLTGTVTDAATGQPVACRLYLQNDMGEWFFPESADAQGSAIPLKKDRGDGSVEMHTTLSAHPFTIALPPGTYTLSAERGPEYLPAETTVNVADQPLEVGLTLKRWVHMAQQGWYSGDTHLHRTVEEMPNLLPAEDLNMGFPLTYWVTQAFVKATEGDHTDQTKQYPPEWQQVGDRYWYYPRNTEYELFTVNGRSHTLGAILVIGHKRPLDLGTPPVGPVARMAKEDGALLDLEKHSWPWSLMLVPVMDVQLFELANNHVWRTKFAFRRWTEEAIPAYMQVERDAQGHTEWGWIDFGFQTYYALLNCGYPMVPTAGTGAGVHPVPTGFGRVYAHVEGELTGPAWLESLRAGRSFVTTGPMLLATVDGKLPGHRFTASATGPHTHLVSVQLQSARPITQAEIIVNGEVLPLETPQNKPSPTGPALESHLQREISMSGSGWVCVRCLERWPDGRLRYAHTAPWWIDVPGQPVRPRQAEVAYLVGRMEEELDRNQDVLPAEALREFEQALEDFRARGKNAR